MNTPKTIKEANNILFKRYINILKENEHLLEEVDLVNQCMSLCKTAIEVDMLEDKQSRWLGFVQGVMIVYKLISVEEERDISRPLFHSAYESMGIEKPKSISV